MIRRATPADAPRILEMAGHFVNAKDRPYHQVLCFNPKAMRVLIDQVLEHGIVLLALEGETAIGMFAALPWRDPMTGRHMLDELAWWVEPAHRKGSVGIKLLRTAENWARQKGLVGVKMIAPWGSNVGRFYDRMGFTPVETSYIKRL